MKKSRLAVAIIASMGTAIMASPHFYVEGGVGYGQLEGENTPSGLTAAEGNNTNNPVNKDQGGFSYRVDSGILFDVTQKMKIGAEIGIYTYPDTTYTYNTNVSPQKIPVSVKFKYSGYTMDALGVINYYITPTIFMIGKAGVGFVNQTSNINASSKVNRKPTSIYSSSTKTTVLPEIAAGVGVNLFSNISVTATYTTTIGGDDPVTNDVQTETTDDLENTANVNAIMVGLRYQF